MRNRVCITALLVVVSQALVPVSLAHAQEKDAVTDMARRRFQEGVKFFDQKRYDEARAAFLQAYALKHHPAVLLNLAQSEIRSGHPVEGARHFSAFLRDASASSAPERSEAERGLAAARTKLGRVQISVSAAGADVLIDGESVGQSPLPEAVDVTPGSHTVEAKLGGRSATSSVSVTVGKSSVTALNLDAPLATAPGPSAPSVAAPPVATSEPEPVADGTPKPAPPANEVAVHLSTDEREPFFQWLTQNPAGLVGLGVTVVGLGVGTGFAIATPRATSSADSIDDQIREEASKKGEPGSHASDELCVPTHGNYAHYATACDLLHDNRAKADTDRTVATVGFIAAGVGAIGTVTMYFLTSGKVSSPTAPQATVAPVVGPHTSGLAIVGRF